MITKTKLDFLVIGAGSGGLAAAKRAAGHGASVGIVEGSRVGGTCVIRGCIPKKLMVYAAEIGARQQLATAFGWSHCRPELSWERLVATRDAVVDRLETIHRSHLSRAGVRLIEGSARLEDAHTVAVADQRISAEHILIATGSTPQLPDVEGSACCITSDGFFELKHRPKRAVLVGGSYIAVEFASILQGLGCQTTLVVRSRLLRGFDDEIANELLRALQRQGVDVRLPAGVARVEAKEGNLVVYIEHNGETHALDADACLLFAIGRQPNTAGLGLEQVGVALGERGEVKVDAHHTTAVPSIHAVGDVIDRKNLSPVAIRAARALADRLFGGSTDGPISYDNIPTAVFSHPPIATVGLTEQEAKERLGDRLRVYRARFSPLLYATSPEEHRGTSLMKMVVDAETDRVLGVHMIGDDAPEIIQGFAVAVVAGLTKRQVDATVAIHPTQAEEFVLMR